MKTNEIPLLGIAALVFVYIFSEGNWQTWRTVAYDENDHDKQHFNN